MPSFSNKFLKVESDRSPVGQRTRLLVLWSYFMAILLGGLWLMPSSMAVANLILMGLNTLIFARWVSKNGVDYYPKKENRKYPPFLPRWGEGTRRYYFVPAIMTSTIWSAVFFGWNTWFSENLLWIVLGVMCILLAIFLVPYLWGKRASRKSKRFMAQQDEERRKQKEIDELIQAAMGRKELEIYEREKEFLRDLAVIIANFHYEKGRKPSKRDAELRQKLEAILEYFVGPSEAEAMVAEELYRLTREAKKATVAT